MLARILVVEDDPSSLRLMVYLLKAAGHQILEAQDGLEGEAILYRERPDLVVCDIQLPKLDGFGLARNMKKHPALKEIPLVAVTAYAMVGDQEQILAAGFDGYIAKPIVPELFAKQVEGFAKDTSPA